MIQKFTPDGRRSDFTSSGLNATFGIAFDTAGNLYAANSGDSTIQKFKPDGTGSLFSGTGLHSPTFIAFTHLPTGSVTPPTELRITAVRISGNNLQISLPASPGQSYAIESLYDLDLAQWEIFTGSAISSIGGTVQITLPIRLDRSEQFFRVHRLP